MKISQLLFILLVVTLLASFFILLPFERISFINSENIKESDSLELEKYKNVKDIEIPVLGSITNYPCFKVAIKIFQTEFTSLSLSSKIYLKYDCIHSPPVNSI